MSGIIYGLTPASVGVLRDTVKRVRGMGTAQGMPTVRANRSSPSDGYPYDPNLSFGVTAGTIGSNYVVSISDGVILCYGARKDTEEGAQAIQDGEAIQDMELREVKGGEFTLPSSWVQEEGTFYIAPIVRFKDDSEGGTSSGNWFFAKFSGKLTIDDALYSVSGSAPSFTVSSGESEEVYDPRSFAVLFVIEITNGTMSKVLNVVYTGAPDQGKDKLLLADIDSIAYKLDEEGQPLNVIELAGIKDPDAITAASLCDILKWDEEEQQMFANAEGGQDVEIVARVGGKVLYLPIPPGAGAGTGGEEEGDGTGNPTCGHAGNDEAANADDVWTEAPYGGGDPVGWPGQYGTGEENGHEEEPYTPACDSTQTPSSPTTSTEDVAF